MTWTRVFTMLLITGLAAAGGQAPSAGPQRGSSEPVLIVRFCDLAGMDASAYSLFRDQATAALRNGGIESIWVYCPSKVTHGQPAQCSSPLQAMEIALLLTPEAPRRGAKWMAASLLRADGTGAHARVYYPRVVQMAEAAKVPVTSLLFLVAVHEICHLLAGPEHHPSGVMRACWSESQIFDLVNRTGAEFHPLFRKRLQAGLAARANQAVAQAR